jgi:hypothetical protein
MRKFFFLIPISSLLSCMSMKDTSIEAVQYDLSQQMPEITLEKELALSFGGGLLGLVKLVAQDDPILAELESVKVAIYNVRGATRGVDFNEISFTSTLNERNSELYWEQIVRVREEDEQVWVFAGMNISRNTLEGISVFVMENETVTVISIDGRVDKMLELALSQGKGRRGAG